MRVSKLGKPNSNNIMITNSNSIMMMMMFAMNDSVTLFPYVIPYGR